MRAVLPSMSRRHAAALATIQSAMLQQVFPICNQSSDTCFDVQVDDHNMSADYPVEVDATA